MKFERLADKIIQVRGIAFNPKDISETPLPDYVPVLKANNIKERGIDTSNLIYIHRSKVRPEQFIKKGDLLLAASSGSKDIVGKNISFENDFDGSFGAFCKLVRPNQKINHNFLAVFFKTPLFKRHIRRLIQGALINNLKNEHIDSLQIPTLSFSEQIQVAKILNKVETLIEQRKQSITLLEKYLRSTFLEMFGDVEKFKVVPITSLCNSKDDIKCGPFGTQLKNHEYKKEGIALWSITNVNKHFTTLPKEFLSQEKALELKQYNLIPDDLVITRKATVGNAAIFPKHFDEGIMHSDLLRIRLNTKAVNPFIILYQFHYSNFIDAQVKQFSGGAVTSGINVSKLKMLNVILPDKKLQTKFANIVTKTETLKEQYNNSLVELENLYGSLSQQAFKGDLEFSKQQTAEANPIAIG